MVFIGEHTYIVGQIKTIVANVDQSNALKINVVGDYQSYMKNSIESKLAWATNLPIYQHVYNTTSHKSIGKFTSSHETLILTVNV